MALLSEMPGTKPGFTVCKENTLYAPWGTMWSGDGICIYCMQDKYLGCSMASFLPLAICSSGEMHIHAKKIATAIAFISNITLLLLKTEVFQKLIPIK